MLYTLVSYRTKWAVVVRLDIITGVYLGIRQFTTFISIKARETLPRLNFHVENSRSTQCMVEVLLRVEENVKALEDSLLHCHLVLLFDHH